MRKEKIFVAIMCHTASLKQLHEKTDAPNNEQCGTGVFLQLKIFLKMKF